MKNILSWSLTIAEGESCWTGAIELADIASWQRMSLNDPVTLNVQGVAFSLLIDSTRINREGGAPPTCSLGVISPTAALADPRAQPRDWEWDETVMASAAAEDAAGQDVEWTLLDWPIPSGRLAFTAATPLDVITTIAEAAGGTVDTRPDGTLRVRHRFPVAVPAWLTATPDALLEEGVILSMETTLSAGARVNQITVRSYSADEESIQLEIDDRADGPNAGHTSFYAGDVVYLLAYHGPGVNGLSAESSAGEVWNNGEVEIQLQEDISFDASDVATLAKPAISLDNVTWLGTDLGDLVLESDRVTLAAKTSGTAIARVSYTAHATSFGLATSESLGDETTYPIDVRVTGETTETPGAGEIVCLRGSSEFPGDDIEEPLLSTLDAKLSRGRAEIDAGETFETITLRTTCQPTLMPGDLIEVQDSLFGAPWRGKITSVTHEQNSGPITTTLEILRHVQPTQ